MVSVIISSYNYGRFIADAIHSLKAQTFSDFECIIVDNGSTDDTADVVRRVSDDRFTYILQENLGVSAGRNAGLKVAKGEYVMFLDADDALMPGKLKATSDFLDQNPGTDLVYTDMRYFRDGSPDVHFLSYDCQPGGRSWMPGVSGSGGTVIGALVESNIMVVCAPLLRMSVIYECGGFDEALLVNEDWELWLRIALAGKTFQFISAPGTLALVRVHASSLSRDPFVMRLYGWRVLRKHASALARWGLQELLSRRVRSHRHAILRMLAASRGATLKEKTQRLRDLDLIGEVYKYTPDSTGLLALIVKLKTIFDTR
jgi:glycosyltransferase involved in cell wall biosynthesis